MPARSQPGSRPCVRRVAAPADAMNKISLLNQLQIDRQQPTRSSGGGRGWWIALATLAVLLIAGVAAWLLIAQPGRARVQTAQAQAAGAGAAAGASLLDASGYVVARRQATVSAKITGKVAQTSIEEGQHVDAGQVIGRLDDSNARAAVAQAQAGVQQASAGLRVAQVQVVEAEPKYRRATT